MRVYITCIYYWIDTLLKKGTKSHTDGWDTDSKSWSHVVLHLPSAEGGFGVTFHDIVADITMDTAFYTSTFVAWLRAFPQHRQVMCLSQDDFQGSSSWSSPPLVLLSDIHSKLLTTMITLRSKEGDKIRWVRSIFEMYFFTW